MADGEETQTSTETADTAPGQSESGGDASALNATPSATGSAQLEVTSNGELVTLHGTGFTPGERYELEFTRPSGRVDPTVANANDDGEFTSYTRAYEKGEHTAVAKDAQGNEAASTTYTA